MISNAKIVPALLRRGTKTAEAVQEPGHAANTWLKPGVNEISWQIVFRVFDHPTVADRNVRAPQLRICEMSSNVFVFSCAQGNE